MKITLLYLGLQMAIQSPLPDIFTINTFRAPESALRNLHGVIKPCFGVS
jgi:hypothetical protein